MSYLGADGSVVSWNLYAYCGNNPISRCDPSGDFGIAAATFVGSLIIGAVASLYTGYVTHEAGYSWEDTIFEAVGAGLCAFGTVYTFGMSAYDFYCHYCYCNGYTPATHIGNPQKQLQSAANTANASMEGNGHVTGTKKHKVFSDIVNNMGNSRIGVEVSYKNEKYATYGTEGSIRFDVVQYNKYGTPIRAWDFKTGSATLTTGRVASMQAKSGLNIPILMIK